METAGMLVGVVGLAGLFSSVLEMAEKVQDYNSHDNDYKALNVGFKAERARFERWGRHVGLDRDHVVNGARSEVETSIIDAVEDLLGVALRALESRSMSVSKSRHSSMRSKTLWALSSKRAQEEDLTKFRRVVQQLHDLIPLPIDTKSQKRSNVLDPAEDLRLRRIVDKIISQKKFKQPHKRKAVFSWLSGSTACTERFTDALESRLDSTCNWILGRPELHRWLDLGEDSPNTLWLKGHAGFGKTVLCAYLTKTLSETLKTPVAAFFSTGFIGDENAYVVIRTWVSQLIQDDEQAFALVFSEFSHPKSNAVASPETVLRLLKTILYLRQGCTLIVDGLDECTGLSRSRLSVEKMLLDLQGAMADDTRVLIVSRYDHEIQRALADNASQGTCEITVTAEDVKEDLSALCQDIFRRKVSKIPDDPRREISDQMVERCDGQFQWLKTQEDTLKSWMKLEQLQRKISSTPKELYEIYDSSWTRIQKGSRRERAYTILRWAACSVRSLTVAEISEAALINDQGGDFSMDDMPEEFNEDFVESEIHELCSPLLRIRTLDQSHPTAAWTISLSHFTVREYLVQKLPVPELQSNVNLQQGYEQMQHNILAQFCLKYISAPHVWTSLSADRPPLFLEYAAMAWYIHVNQSMVDSADPKTMELALTFMSASHPCWIHWRKWFDKYKEDSCEREGEPHTLPPDPLYYALKLHMRSVVSEKMQAVQHVPQQTTPGRSAFHVACSLGDIATVQTFLDAGTDVHVRGWGGRTPIFTAAVTGQNDIIRLLLDRGGDVNITKIDGQAPLHTAVDNGHYETVKLLLDGGARQDPRAPREWVPLHTAAWRGCVDIMELMLNNGGMRYIDAQTVRGITPIHFSVVTEHLAVVKCLLERGADLHLGDKAGWLPIHAAAGRGNFQIVETLLNAGASINTPVRPASLQEGFVGWNGIHLASYYHRRSTLDQLLEMDLFDTADLDARTASRGETPLLLAATSGHTYAVQLLLTRAQVSVNAKDWSGHSALYLATQQGHVSTVEALLGDERVLINEANFYGLTPLDVAVRNGHLCLVELLLAAVNQSDDFRSKLEGTHTLAWAGHTGVPEILEFLDRNRKDLSTRALDEALADVPVGEAVRAHRQKRAWCYACTLCFPQDGSDLGKRCAWCDGGYLYLCASCVSRGKTCRGKYHALVKLQEDDFQRRYEYTCPDVSATST